MLGTSVVAGGLWGVVANAMKEVQRQTTRVAAAVLSNAGVRAYGARQDGTKAEGGGDAGAGGLRGPVDRRGGGGGGEDTTGVTFFYGRRDYGGGSVGRVRWSGAVLSCRGRWYRTSFKPWERVD